MSFGYQQSHSTPVGKTFASFRVLARVLGGPKIFLSADDLGFGCHLMLDGYWESWLTLFFARYVTPGKTVIDVGANFGYYTILFAAGVGPSGRVVAIEPVPAIVSSSGWLMRGSS
jgi:hypothetical protein